jgi:hypothetical protein
MDSHILNETPESLTVEKWHEDDSTGQIHIEQVQDVTPIVEANKALYNLSDGVPRFGDGKRVASIPMVIYMELKRQGIAQDEKKLRQWLNDPDNRAFRTLPGVL